MVWLTLTGWGDAPAHALMGSLFLVSGVGKLTEVASPRRFMEPDGVPGIFPYPTATFEIASGCLLLTGLWMGLVSLLLVAFWLITAFI